MSAKKVTIVLICCLFVVLGAAVCALLELYPKDALTAEAASAQRPRFVIATANGVDWTLSLNGENVDGAECSGRFTDTSNSVAKRMYESIKQSLRNMGLDVPAEGDFVVAEYCDIAFELPSISSQVDANEAAYGSDGVFFKQDINDVISTPRVYFEYRKRATSNGKKRKRMFCSAATVSEEALTLANTRCVSSQQKPSCLKQTRTASKFSTPQKDAGKSSIAA